MKYEEKKSNENDIIKVNIMRTLNLEAEERFTPEVDSIEIPTTQSSTVVSKINNSVRPSTEPSQVFSTKGKRKPCSSLESNSNSTIACPVHLFRGIGCPETSRSKSVGTACTCPIDAQSQVSSSCIKDKNNKNGKRAGCSTLESKIETNTTASYPNSVDDKTYFSKFCPTGKKTKKAVASRNYTHDFTHPCYCPGSMKPRSAG